MKFELKVVVLSLLFSFACMCVFTYVLSFAQKEMYVYQVGIYKEEVNKDNKLSELKEMGIDGYCYEKENQFYVLSMISPDEKEVEQHATKVKGVMKTYVVSYDTTPSRLLDYLARSRL